MSTILQLSRESHRVLETLLKRAICENALLVRRCPSLESKVAHESAEFHIILDQLLKTPLLSGPQPDAFAKKLVRVPESDRPKHRIA